MRKFTTVKSVQSIQVTRCYCLESCVFGAFLVKKVNKYGVSLTSLKPGEDYMSEKRQQQQDAVNNMPSARLHK